MRKNKNKGFTILELLVVIAIAAMILSVVFSQMRATRQKSRDARREQDMKQLQDALAIHANNAFLYPVCPVEVVINGTSDCLSSALLSSKAMQGRVSFDPLDTGGGTCGGADSYVYCYQSANGASYSLRYRLETNAIPGKSAGWQPAIGP